MVIGLADELRRVRKVGSAMLAGARRIDRASPSDWDAAADARRRAACAVPEVFLSLARGLVSLARRRGGIFAASSAADRVWRAVRVDIFDSVKRSIASACERMRRISVSLSSESSVSRSIHSLNVPFRCQTFPATPTPAQSNSARNEDVSNYRYEPEWQSCLRRRPICRISNKPRWLRCSLRRTLCRLRYEPEWQSCLRRRPICRISNKPQRLRCGLWRTLCRQSNKPEWQ